MNIATIIGIIIGMTIVCVATYFSTESVGVFINLPGIAIVLGGTMAATLICYPLRELGRIFTVFLTALKADELPISNYIKLCVGISKIVSQKGHVHLEKIISGNETVRGNDILKSGLQMVVDGYSKEEIKAILDNRISQYYEQETSSAGIFRTMARLSPAFGITGTLIGLIGMMQAMGNDIGSLGPAMAVALTTTLYGVLLANMFFLPISIKVEKRVEEVTILMTVIRDGILFVKDKTPPQIVDDKLQGYLPPRRWGGAGSRGI